METTAFYTAAGGVAFTLLGLWWATLGFTQGGWRDDPTRRRLVLHVALGLLLLGTMSLVSLVSGPLDKGLIWRVAFIGVGAVGVREALGWVRPSRRPAGVVGLLAAAAAPVFALTILVAFVPADATLNPRQIEALVVTANLARIMCVIWYVLSGWSEPSEAAADGTGS